MEQRWVELLELYRRAKQTGLTFALRLAFAVMEWYIAIGSTVKIIYDDGSVKEISSFQDLANLLDELIKEG
jgi:hypothetical protein